MGHPVAEYATTRRAGARPAWGGPTLAEMGTRWRRHAAADEPRYAPPA
jgi:hypothetical protein